MTILTLVIIAVAVWGLVWLLRPQRSESVPPSGSLSTEQTELAARLRQHVEMLAATIGERNLWHYPGLDAAAGYIEAQLKTSGLRFERQEYLVAQTRVKNLIAELPGTERAGEILVVGAHYDSVSGSPGANDNASGIAALLELAERLAGKPHLRTLRLVAFTNEEPPFFKGSQMGSRRYADRTRARGEEIIGMICLETIGYYSRQPSSQDFPLPGMELFYPDRGDFIAFVSKFSSRKFLQKCLTAFRRHSRFPAEKLVAPAWLPGVDWSDHWSFWRVGYPAVMLTDSAFYRYRYYHSGEDTPDKLNYPEFSRLVEGLVAMVDGLLNSDRERR